MVSVVMMGASGAVGGEVLRCLSALPEVTRITVLNRRAMPDLDPKADEHIIDPGDPQTYAHLLSGHDRAICTLGVGEPSKVSHDDFLRVDHDMPLAFATAARTAGIDSFALLSAIDVNAGSRIFYLRTKGDLEVALSGLGFDHLVLAHPCIILTPTNRYGLSQGMLLALWPRLHWMMPGRLHRYRGIAARDLGRALALKSVQGAAGAQGGVAVLEWDAMIALSRAG